MSNPENAILTNVCEALTSVAVTDDRIDDTATAALFVLGGYHSPDDDLLRCTEEAQKQLTTLQVELMLQINRLQGELAITHRELTKNKIDAAVAKRITRWQARPTINDKEQS